MKLSDTSFRLIAGLVAGFYFGVLTEAIIRRHIMDGIVVGVCCIVACEILRQVEKA